MSTPPRSSPSSLVDALRRDFDDWMLDAAPALQRAGLRRLPVPSMSRRTVAQFERGEPGAPGCSLSLLLARVENADGAHDALTWLVSTPDATGDDCIFVQELCRLEGRSARQAVRESLLSTEPESVLAWARAELLTAGYAWPAP